jgi:hypothetical protein
MRTLTVLGLLVLCCVIAVSYETIRPKHSNELGLSVAEETAFMASEESVIPRHYQPRVESPPVIEPEIPANLREAMPAESR